MSRAFGEKWADGEAFPHTGKGITLIGNSRRLPQPAVYHLVNVGDFLVLSENAAATTTTTQQAHPDEQQYRSG